MHMLAGARRAHGEMSTPNRVRLTRARPAKSVQVNTGSAAASDTGWHHTEQSAVHPSAPSFPDNGSMMLQHVQQGYLNQLLTATIFRASGYCRKCEAL
jgi:hypothetical protein